jgi:hypothetical protein
VTSAAAVIVPSSGAGQGKGWGLLFGVAPSACASHTVLPADEWGQGSWTYFAQVFSLLQFGHWSLAMVFLSFVCVVVVLLDVLARFELPPGCPEAIRRAWDSCKWQG